MIIIVILVHLLLNHCLVCQKLTKNSLSSLMLLTLLLHENCLSNYPALCELEEKHGVTLGSAYCNKNSGKDFCHFIAESKHKDLIQNLGKTIFSPFLWMDQLI